MNYKVISCTNELYVGWTVSIPRLHRGTLKVTRSDGAAATFPVVHINKDGGLVTLSNSNFIVQLQEL